MFRLPSCKLSLRTASGTETDLRHAYYSCQYWTLIEVHLHLLFHASIHGLVALRVSAVWGHRKDIKYTLIGLWSIYFAINAVIGSRAAFSSYRMCQ